MSDYSDDEVLAALVSRAEQDDPHLLYRYRGATTPGEMAGLRASIVDGTLKLGSPLAFNDPFDCYPAAEIIGSGPELIRKLRRSFYTEGGVVGRRVRHERAKLVAKNRSEMGMDDLLESALEATLVNTHVVCFAERWDNLLMWSHYAQSHAGVCIQYTRQGVSKLIAAALPVHYDDERPVIDLFGDNPAIKMRKILYTKSTVWDYEKEWRLVLHQHDPVQQLPAGTVSSVYLGAKMNPVQRQSVIEMCREANVPVVQAAFHRRLWQLLPQDPDLFDKGFR